MKSSRKQCGRKLYCQLLETRRLLAGDVAAGLAAGLPVTNAESASAVEEVDPPETQSRVRDSDLVIDSPGAHKRPGEGFPNVDSENMEPLAVDVAMVAEVTEQPVSPAVYASRGPAPNAGDGVPDGSGMDAPQDPVGDGDPFGPAPNSGDGVSDGSGMDAPRNPV